MNNQPKTYPPTLWVPTAYFAMGLPYVVLSVATVIMFSSKGISDGTIAFWTSLIMLPWTLKPLWSPFLEMFKTKKFFVVFTEIFSGVLFGLVALTLSLPHFFAYAIAVLAIIAFSGASHDIATDGVYLTALDSKKQAQFIGWQGASYNIAKILTNSVLIYFAGYLEETIGIVQAWTIVMITVGMLMVMLGLINAYILPTGSRTAKEINSPCEAMLELWDVLKSFFQKKYILWYILFIILYRFAEGFAVKIVPLFLKAATEVGGLGLSTKDIGLVYGFGAAAFVAGSILGGYFISTLGLRKALIYLCCAFNVPFIVYLMLAVFRPESLWWIGGAVVTEYFGYGFGFVGLMLFMMQQVAPGKHQMSHYAFATAIMNLGVMLPSMASGYLSDWLGYKTFFVWVLIATIPAFLVTIFVPFGNPDISTPKSPKGDLDAGTDIS